MRVAISRTIGGNSGITGHTHLNLACCIESYILAKDGNRPYRLSKAFEPDATVLFDVRTDRISFPSCLRGRDAIAEALVRQFSHDYENVYTFCIARPPEPTQIHFSCHWLVAMTSRQDQSLRIGWGRYDWERQSKQALPSRLRITIVEMTALPARYCAPVLDWVADVPYPWCSPEQLWSGAPDFEELAGWRERIAKCELSER